MKFVIIPGVQGRWSWELRNNEGLAISKSTASYSDRGQVEAAIESLRRGVASAGLFGPTGARLDDFVVSHSPKEKNAK